MAELAAQTGGVAIQAEDEIASMGLGAAMAGRKVLTATSGPGIRLYSETIGLATMGAWSSSTCSARDRLGDQAGRGRHPVHPLVHVGRAIRDRLEPGTGRRRRSGRRVRADGAALRPAGAPIGRGRRRLTGAVGGNRRAGWPPPCESSSLFVDDVPFTAALAEWIGVGVLALPRLPITAEWDAPLLALGFAVILVVSTWRAPRQG